MKGHFHFAEKKGYSGVGLYSAQAPSAVRLGFGDAEFDAEGRYVEARFDRAGARPAAAQRRQLLLPERLVAASTGRRPSSASSR